MKHFIKKIFAFSLFAIIPIFVFGIVYSILDPFKVLKTYDSFYDENATGWVGINKDYVSTSTFIRNNENRDYNSFIFGSSRSIFFQVKDWKKYLDSNSKCFHFDASGEALWALNKKIEFIDKQGNRLSDILLILDYSTIIQDKPKEGHLFIISPPLVNNSNLFDFHKTFFSAFLNPKFLFAYLDFTLNGKVKPYMKKAYLLDDRPHNYDINSNEIRYDYFEYLIQKNKYYTPERLSVFYERDTLTQDYSPHCIFESQKVIFNNIKSITNKHNSRVKIIISPLYDQKKLNDQDIAYLKDTFGANNVFDFSGINKYTNDYKNYYESSHYRPHVARELLKITYE